MKIKISKFVLLSCGFGAALLSTSMSEAMKKHNIYEQSPAEILEKKANKAAVAKQEKKRKQRTKNSLEKGKHKFCDNLFSYSPVENHEDYDQGKTRISSPESVYQEEFFDFSDDCNDEDFDLENTIDEIKKNEQKY